jgi:hypothetical protein
LGKNFWVVVSMAADIALTTDSDHQQLTSSHAVGGRERSQRGSLSLNTPPWHSSKECLTDTAPFTKTSQIRIKDIPNTSHHTFQQHFNNLATHLNTHPKSNPKTFKMQKHPEHDPKHPKHISSEHIPKISRTTFSTCTSTSQTHSKYIPQRSLAWPWSCS